MYRCRYVSLFHTGDVLCLALGSGSLRALRFLDRKLWAFLSGWLSDWVAGGSSTNNNNNQQEDSIAASPFNTLDVYAHSVLCHYHCRRESCVVWKGKGRNVWRCRKIDKNKWTYMEHGNTWPKNKSSPLFTFRCTAMSQNDNEQIMKTEKTFALICPLFCRWIIIIINCCEENAKAVCGSRRLSHKSLVFCARFCVRRMNLLVWDRTNEIAPYRFSSSPSTDRGRERERVEYVNSLTTTTTRKVPNLSFSGPPMKENSIESLWCFS